MSIFDVYRNKKVLITGHTGFKGSWLAMWLMKLGAQVTGLSMNVPTEPSHYISAHISESLTDYRIDIRDATSLEKLVLEIKPDMVFHLAAQALVRPAYEDPLGTMMTNAIGSANLLFALQKLDKPVVVVMVTSDKAYDNVEWVWGYRESDRLGGKDPYSASKGMAELAIRSFFESYFHSNSNNVRLGIARAGNVIGGGDWSIDRIVPDCIRAWSQMKKVDIRRPHSTRPWQHVLEPLSGYLALACSLERNVKLNGEAYNFGPSADQNYSVEDLINEMSKHWNNVRWNNMSQKGQHLHEAGLLKLNCDKALFDLKWSPTLNFEETVRITIDWYKAYYQQTNNCTSSITLAQIDEYTKIAHQRNISWAIQ
jgi:CDP-glucose 4,6-dehydratase